MTEEIYIGTKIIAAEPMNGIDFARKFRREEVSEDYGDRPGYKVRYEDGYVSWSPKETFERAYRKITRAEMEMVLEEMFKVSGGFQLVPFPGKEE